MSSQNLPDPAGFPRPFPVVGRLSEQSALRACLDTSVAGYGGLVLIAGEAGIGKSTLVEWLGGEARERGFQTVTGQCYDLTLTPPYGPWADALAQLARGAPGGVHPHRLPVAGDTTDVASQSELFADMIQFLRAVTHYAPLLLVLEDIHWADPASLDLLRHIGRGAGNQPLLLVATYRGNELDAGGPLARLLPHMAREARVVRLDLPALDCAAVRAVVASRYVLDDDDTNRLVAYLQQRSGGNPFYLTEVLRTLEHERFLAQDGPRWRVGALEAAPVPPLVRQVIEGRLATLTYETRRALEVAAAIGQHVPRDLWTALSEVEQEAFTGAVEDATQARLLGVARDGRDFVFEHALVRETIHGLQPHALRQDLHRRVAEALMERAATPSAGIAAHLELADDPRAVDWLVTAGDEALAMYAAQDAVAFYSRARTLAARHGGELPLAAYRDRARANELLGEFDAARRDLELVLDRAQNAGDLLLRWHTLTELGLLWTARDYERTGSYAQAALDLARQLGDPALVGHSLNRVANWYVNIDEAEVALGLHGEALAIFEAAGDRHGVADTLDMLGMANYLTCDLHASTACYERAIPIFRELDERQRLATCLAAMTFNGGDHDSSVAEPVYREPSFWVACSQESLATAREIGWRSGEAFALFGLAATNAIRGQFGPAMRDAERMLEIAESIEHREWTTAARHMLGAFWLDLLDLPAAQTELEAGLTVARTSGSRFWIVSHIGTLVQCHAESGNLSAADSLLQSVLQPDRPRWSSGQRTCWYAWSQLELARGDYERALAIVDRMSEPRPDGRPAGAIPHLTLSRGRALALLGCLAEAEQALTLARDMAALHGYRTLLWRVDLALGQLWHANGRPERAAASFRAAHATIDAIAGTLPDERAREQFRSRAAARLPDDGRDRDVSVPATGLSPREIDVLRLLVEGKSDREIAEALFISPRTVMRHVTAILTKLDVSSRTAAASVAIRNTLV